MLPPPSRIPARWSLLGLLVLASLLTALPSAFSLGSAGAESSVGATGGDPRSFPRTFHIWGGAPSNYTKYDFVIGYPSWNIASLRAANPDAIYLMNPQLDPTNPDWRLRKGLAVTNGGANTFTGGTDSVVDGAAANLGTIPGWNTYWDTLHRPDGSVALINSEWGHPGWNLTRPDTADKVAEIMAYGSKLSRVYSDGWDGVWSDNWIYRIGAGWFYGSNLDTNRDGQADDMSVVSRQWWDGLNLVGQRLRTYLPGKIVGGNGSYNISGLAGGSDPSGPFKASNATLNEVLQFYTSKPDTVVSEVQGYLGFADPHGMPRYFLFMHDLPGGQSDYRSMRWGFSLVTIAGGYYEPYANSHEDAFSYDEFTGGALAKRGWLGQPASAPTKLSNGVWRRDFANGVVLNNSTSSAQTVSLGGTYQRLRGSQDAGVNNGASVSSVTIPAGDGLFLVGSSSAPLSVPQNTAAPTISGNPVVGQVLTASRGTWSGSPTAYAYQWQRCDASASNCVDVVAAKSAGYSVTELDAGSRMRVKVTATNGAGSTTATSAATGTVTDPFDVTQSIADGSTLSATITWTVSPSGKSVSKVDFSVDGKVVAADASSPFSATLNTTSLANGTHVFAVQATATDGSNATASANAIVSNQESGLTVSHSLSDGQMVSGSVRWAATASGKTVARVEFAVDGAVVATDSLTPYEVTVDTNRFANGTHSFAVKAYASDGSTAGVSASVLVSNSAPSSAPSSFSVTQNMKEGQVVSGTVDWTAQPTGKTVKRLEFSVDGRKVATVPKEPYDLRLDTRELADGTHGLGVLAYASDGTTARSNVRIVVANQVPPPPTVSPAPTAPPTQSLSVSQNVTSGQTLSASVSWTASPAGKTVARVEFFVDGRMSWTENLTPYVYSGDGNRLDTRTLADGSHTLSVKAYATDGSTATASASVEVSNSTPSLTLISSIKDGSTITGQVSWTVTPTGAPVSRMEFYIDNVLKWTERLSPWHYGGDNQKLDTRTLSRGQHTLVVKAYAADGTVVVLTLRVTVA